MVVYKLKIEKYFVTPNFVEQKLQYLFTYSEKINKSDRDTIQAIKNDLSIHKDSKKFALVS